MTSVDDGEKTVLRNMLLGRWAAKKLGMSKADAKAYSHALAEAALDPQRNDVFRKLRTDFDAAGVTLSDEQILAAMSEFMIEAGQRMPSNRGDSMDAAGAMLKHRLTGR